MVSGESRKDLHERWLLRHGLPDAVSQWHDAPADRAPTLAFIAVASDSRILSKLRHDMAETLAEQAERLARDMVAAEGTIDVTRAAAEEVTLRVAVWRHALATGWRPASRSDAAGRRMGLLPAEPDPATTERELFQRALRRHPEFIEPIARRLAVVTWQLGADGLIELGPPFDGVLALSAARIAAGVARGPASASLRPAERLALLGIVEDWAERTGLNPCIVPLQGGRGCDRGASGGACDRLGPLCGGRCGAAGPPFLPGDVGNRGGVQRLPGAEPATAQLDRDGVRARGAVRLRRGPAC